MRPACTNREEWLGPHVYGDLPFDEGMAAEEHLRACAACRREEEPLRRLVSWMPAAPPAPSAAPPSRAWAIAAAALVALSVGYLAGRETSPPPATRPTPTASASAPSGSIFSPDVLAYLERGRAALPDDARRAMNGR